MKRAKSQVLHKLLSAINKTIKGADTRLQDRGRRKFISRSAMAMAGMALSSGLPVLSSCRVGTGSKNEPHDDVLDVAILGSGISGLNCANHLLNSGLNFRVFEADRRAGGRILTHYNDPLGIGVYPEFGGDFIDSNHEDMLALAREFNLGLVDLIEEQEEHKWIKDIYFFDGRRISEKEIIKEFKKIAPKIAHDAKSLGEAYDTEAAVKLDHTPLADYIESLPCAKWLKELFVAAWVAEYGLDCSELSTLNMLDMIDTDTEEGFYIFGDSDERYRIEGGNTKVIEGLISKIGADRIQLNYEVQSIEETEESTYKIGFKNEKSIKARAVVCTLPFTILRNLDLKLKNVSPLKQKCIDELGYGKNTKLVLAYDGQPWRNKKSNAMGYLFTNDMTNGWDGSVNRQKGSSHGAYVAYFGGEFSQKLSDESFKNALAPPTHSWRTELPEPTVNGFVTELDRIFPHSKEKYLNKHIFVNWIEYPYVKASYSCYKTGQWTSIAGLEMEPIGNFFFAGEHCSELFQGFMNGGAETGRVVAQRVKEKIAIGENAVSNA